MRAAIELLRDAPWMTLDRARSYRNVLLTLYAVATVAIIATSHAGRDFYARPIGTDFISFWTASGLALAGDPARAYDVSSHWAAQQAAFPGASLNYTAFFYPPMFLLICLPLALLPYLWALAAWLGVTGGLCWAALVRLGRGQGLALLAFPAVWQNAVYGQNGFLTTALFAAAIAMLETRPVRAGVALGCLIFKPHFLLMVPVALIAARQWRTAAAAAGTAMLLSALSLGVFGLDTWRGFLTDSALARAALEQNFIGNEKMQSAFAAVRLLSGSVTAAYTVQALLALAVAAVLAYTCRAATDRAGIGAALAVATLLATPFLLVYDMMLLAIPLVWMADRARVTGFRPWEKTAMVAAFIMPMLSVELAHFLLVPIAPLTVVLLFALIVRRLLNGV